MKFQPRVVGKEGRKPFTKSMDAVGLWENGGTGLEFDVKKVFDSVIWDRVDRVLKADRTMRPSAELPLLRLVLLDSALRSRAEQDDELPGQIQVAIYNVAQYELDADMAMNAELAKYADLFPAVMNGLDDPLTPSPHDFQKSLDSFDGYSLDRDMEILAPRMRALLRLFPEKRDVIFKKIDELQFWDKGMKGARELSAVPGEALNYLPGILAHLAVIFPERKEEILELIRPRWRQLQDRLTSWGNQLDIELDHPEPTMQPGSKSVTSYVDNILGMAYLAELSQVKTLSTPSKLPERLVS